jgi:hypothetical protein
MQLLIFPCFYQDPKCLSIVSSKQIAQLYTHTNYQQVNHVNKHNKSD